MLNSIIRYFLVNKLVTILLLALFVGWGVVTAPFNWNLGVFPRDPVPVDAIPDIGENQQIVFTEWMGRSPQDVEDQITYPLTSSLLGMPGVKSVRSTSMFGFSSIYIIFDESVEYYWSRTRVLEKLNSLPPQLLPQGVAPTLGPDATALGQVYWYTLEGRDEKGKPAGGWDPHELRTIQDFYVRNSLTAVEGVSEVASIGGFVKEYQVDLDPIAMKAHGVGIMQVVEALRNSNQDVGANTVEINMAEYLVRGLGYIQSTEEIEQTVVKLSGNVPIRVRDISKVNIGPAPRGHNGFLDKGGVEAVGGVVVARYGDNPLQVIQHIKDKIEQIRPGLPAKTLADGRVSKVTLVPFYDRSSLIYETIGTLYQAISLQILITIIVLIAMVMHLRASLLISALLPIAVLMSFIMMKYLNVDANIVALSGIAIAIGTMVDLGIILSENVLRHQKEAPLNQPILTTVYNASAEVSSAILTAVSTTVVSFLPVFTLQAAEGKLFGPLAYTKTFGLVAALIVTFTMLPAFAHFLFSIKEPGRKWGKRLQVLLMMSGVAVLWISPWAGVVLMLLGLNGLFRRISPERISHPRLRSMVVWHGEYHQAVTAVIIAVAVSWLLAGAWMPLGLNNPFLANFLFILLVIVSVIGSFRIFIRYYPVILKTCLEHKTIFLAAPALIMVLGVNIWLGFDKVFGIIPQSLEKVGVNIRATAPWSMLSHAFPGMGKEFMPSLDEGSFLLMPTSMPHSGMEANLGYIRQLDMRVQAIPEVELVVGKAGRVESALDPAPISMFENIITYKSEFKTDENGYSLRYRIGKDGDFLRDEGGDLIPDKKGKPFRQWRDHIRTPDDIWNEIVNATNDIPGLTSAPKLHPIETRLVMLQTGMRAPMGIKVFGPDLQSIEEFSLKLERLLKEIPSVKPEAVYADRSLGKPYLEIDLNREAMGRYGLSVGEVQHYIEVAIGGMPLTTTVEGRERFNIRARYAREYRDDPESIKRILISSPMGAQIPLEEVAEIRYRAGPMMIRGEDTFLVGYVLLDKQEGFSEVTVVEDAQRFLSKKIADGELLVPPGVSYQFSGTYENQVRAEKRLAIVIPLVLVIIFLILYFQFQSVAVSLMIFSSIAMAFAGGFIMLWLYGQTWFLGGAYFGIDFRELFQIRAFNLSVAVWVGFIALFGLATDDGVLIATYMKQSFAKRRPSTVVEIRQAVLEAGMRRIRPCLMTSATTLLALLPVLTSRGRGSDIMIPMAIPVFGGMTVVLITLFVVPVLYAAMAEYQVKTIAGKKQVTEDV